MTWQLDRRTFFHTSAAAGLMAAARISLADEHVWNPSQYMSPEVFRGRLQLLKKSGCTVLGLAEGDGVANVCGRCTDSTNLSFEVSGDGLTGHVIFRRNDLRSGRQTCERFAKFGG